MLTIKNKAGKKRIGKLRTKSGVISTPFFMPIATKGAVKHISSQEIHQIGYELVLSNTYHLWLNPGDGLVKNAGGLHNFMSWRKPILTDSGGFQVFSLGARAKERTGVSAVKLTEEGVHFVDLKNGKKHFLTPEKSIQIQLNLGADIIMCLDVCPPYPCTQKESKDALELTARWAKRCKEYFDKKIKIQNKKSKGGKDPLLFGIVQGSIHENQRKKSAKQIVDIGFDGYAIGGVAVGEPREKMAQVLDWVLPYLPDDKPRYLMGLGKPEEVVSSVHAGIDMFDCVIPTREARHGRIFFWNKRGRDGLIDDNDFYSTINIRNEKYKNDMNPVDLGCNCPLCSSYSRAYIRHLFSVGEPLAGRLASVHNLTFYHELIKKLSGN